MQFGGALPRILWLLRHADPREGPMYLAKYDISDGFYGIFLDPDDALKLGVLMPRYDGEPQLVAVPLSLTMGWVSSPPTFCAASETAADIANASLYRHTVPPHRLENIASAHDCWGPPPPDPIGPPALLCPTTNPPALLLPPPLPQPEDRAPLITHQGPVAHVDVFVDDFIGVTQGSQRRCNNARRCIMHAVDRVFARPYAEAAHWKEAISEKKLNKGDGGWCQ